MADRDGKDDAGAAEADATQGTAASDTPGARGPEAEGQRPADDAARRDVDAGAAEADATQGTAASDAPGARGPEAEGQRRADDAARLDADAAERTATASDAPGAQGPEAEGQRPADDAARPDADAAERTATASDAPGAPSAETDATRPEAEARAPDAAAEGPDGAAPAGSSRRPRVEAGSPPERKPAAWGRPFVRADAAWTKWEMWLCAVVLVLEVLVLSVWVGLKGLSTPADGSSKAGLVFRALTGALALGLVTHFALRRQEHRIRSGATVAAAVLGLLLAKTWGRVGVEWASNLLNWYQQASFLTLLGGLRGVGTRLTLLLTLIGGSLATAAGKHITIDLLTRYLRPKQRLPVVVAGWLGASAIVTVCAWGFFDHIAIDEFDAPADATAGQKVSKVGDKLGEHFFAARKQLALDFKTLPHVLKGERYSEWMSGSEWNGWVDGAGFAERYGKDKAELLKLPPDAKKTPIVVIPAKGEPRGELVKVANLVFPIGLLIIALRFLLLCLLALSGHKSVDSEAHADLSVVSGGKSGRKVEDEAAEGRA